MNTELGAAAWEAKAVRTSNPDEKQAQSSLLLRRPVSHGEGDNRDPWRYPFRPSETVLRLISRI